MRIERVVALPTPPQEVWDVLVDWERQADWMRDADRVEVLTQHRTGTGVSVAVRTRVVTIPAFTDRLEVLEWDPPTRLVVAHRRFVRGTGEWLLEPVDGGTRFTWIEEVTLPLGLLGRSALAVYRPAMGVLMRTAQQDLRRFVISLGPRSEGVRATWVQGPP